MNMNRQTTPYTSRLSGSGWLAALAASAWLLVALPAQAQACTPFLEVLSPDRQTSVLSLNTCEVSAAQAWAESPSSKVWQLTAAAQQRWAAALQGEPLLLPLMDAQLRTRHLAEGLQSGPLLNRISARLVSPASWRWDARSGELALLELQSAGVNLCRETQPVIFWFGTRDIGQGGQLTAEPKLIYSSSYARALPNSCIDAWRIEPAQFATVDPQGQVQIAEGAPHGAAVTLIALLGPKEVRGALRVMDPQHNPLIGTWRQVSETPCETGVARTPLQPVREFKLDGSGNFAVTITPFEARKDYWGTYTYDAVTGAIRFSVVSGNKVPQDLKLAGRASIVRGKLELIDVSLWPLPGGIAICGMQFSMPQR